MLADITVKVSEFQASARKLEQQLIHLRAIQKSLAPDVREKLKDIINSINDEVDKIHVFMENDKKSRAERIETNQSIREKLKQQKQAQQKLQAVQQIEKQWYPKKWSDAYQFPYSVYQGITKRDVKSDVKECLIHPLSLLFQIWNSFHLLIALAFMISLPVGLAFPAQHVFVVPLVVCWTIMKIADTFMILNTGIILEQELDMDPKSVMRYHWKTGSIVWNAVLGFPYVFIVDSLTVYGSPERTFGRLICLVNAVGFVRLILEPRTGIISSKISQLIRHYEVNQSLVKSVQIIGGMAIYCHWFSCSIRILQRYSLIHDYVNSTFEADYYIGSLFDSASIMFSAAWGVGPPTGTHERWPKVINMLMSTFLYALFTANITAFMVRLDSSGRLFAEKLEEVGQYLKYKNVGRDVQERVVQYYQFKYSQGKYFNEDQILGELNEPLRVAISLRECRSLITSVPYFKDADHRFVSQAVTLLRICHYLADDLILEHDTTGDQMFFIESGNVEVILQGKTVAVLGPGNYFGEVSLLFGHMKRTASVRAITNCVMYTLSQSNLEQILELNPDMANKMRDIAEERIRMNQVIIMAPANVNDAFVPFVDQTFGTVNNRTSVTTPGRSSAVRTATILDQKITEAAVNAARAQSFIAPLIDPNLIRASIVVVDATPEQSQGNIAMNPSTMGLHVPSAQNSSMVIAPAYGSTLLDPRREVSMNPSLLGLQPSIQNSTSVVGSVMGSAMFDPSRSVNPSVVGLNAPSVQASNVLITNPMGSNNLEISREISMGSSGVYQNSQEKIPMFTELSVGAPTTPEEKLRPTTSFRLKDANNIFGSGIVGRSGSDGARSKGRARSGTLTNRRGVEIHSLKGNIEVKDPEPPKNEAFALPFISPNFLFANLDPNSEPSSSIKFVEVDDTPDVPVPDALVKPIALEDSLSVSMPHQLDSGSDERARSPRSKNKSDSVLNFAMSVEDEVVKNTAGVDIPQLIVEPPTSNSPKPERPQLVKEGSYLGAQTKRASPLRFAAISRESSIGDVKSNSGSVDGSKDSDAFAIQVDPMEQKTESKTTETNPFADPSSATQAQPESVLTSESKLDSPVLPKAVATLANESKGSLPGSPSLRSSSHSLRKGIQLRVVTPASESAKSVGFAPSIPNLNPAASAASGLNAPLSPTDDMVPTTPYVAAEVRKVTERRKTFADITMGKQVHLPPTKWTWKRFWNTYQPSLTYCPLNPDMLVSKIWNAIAQFSFFLVAVLLPLAFGFEEQKSILQPISIFVSVICALDWIIKMQTGLKVYDEVEMDPRKLFTRYLRNGTYLFDIITGVPWVFIIDMATSNDPGSQDCWRLFCLVHVLPFLRSMLNSRKSILAELLTTYIRKHNVNASAVKAVKILLTIIFYWHWHSCSANYIMRIQLIPNPFPTLKGGHAYILHFWASATEMLNAGCGAVPPEVSLDRILKVVNMIFNVTLVALYVGNISSFMIGLDSSGRQFNEQLEQVSQFVTYKGLGRELKAKIMDYYQFKYSKGKYFDESKILQELNESLRMSIYMRECRALVLQVPFFKGAENGFISQVVMILKPEHYLSGDVVMEKGTAGDLMFFIANGMLEVIVNDNVVAKLGPGQFFGEIALLFGHMRRTATIRAMTNCNLYSLSRSELNYILELYPEMSENIRKTAEERMVKDINRK